MCRHSVGILSRLEKCLSYVPFALCDVLVKAL